MAVKIIDLEFQLEETVKSGDALVIRYPSQRAHNVAPVTAPSIAVWAEGAAIVQVDAYYGPIDKVLLANGDLSRAIKRYPWPLGPISADSEQKDNYIVGKFSAIIVEPTGGGCLVEGGW